MIFNAATFQKIPFVFTGPGSPIHDLVAAGRDESTDDIYRSIWADFREELLARLEALAEKDLSPGELRDELHSLRGSSAQFGLFLLETFLFAWEKKEEDPVGASFKYLPGSVAIARLSLDAIERDFPHLKPSQG